MAEMVLDTYPGSRKPDSVRDRAIDIACEQTERETGEVVESEPRATGCRMHAPEVKAKLDLLGHDSVAMCGATLHSLVSDERGFSKADRSSMQTRLELPLQDLDRLPSSSGEASTRKRFGSASTWSSQCTRNACREQPGGFSHSPSSFQRRQAGFPTCTKRRNCTYRKIS
jgi:hypothetical protein